MKLSKISKILYLSIMLCPLGQVMAFGDLQMQMSDAIMEKEWRKMQQEEAKKKALTSDQTPTTPTTTPTPAPATTPTPQ